MKHRPEIEAFGWVIGYFLALSPIHYAIGFGFIQGLLHSIFGLAVAIGLILYGRKKNKERFYL